MVALRVVAIAVLLVALGGTAHAGKVAVANVSAEPDFADEAGAITLLVRSAMAGDDRVVIDAPAGFTAGAALVMLEKVGADHAVIMDLGRQGLKLRLTVVIVPAKETPIVKVVTAGDGDVVTLARAAVEFVTTTLKLMKPRAPDVSLGRLRPFATAFRLRAKDPHGAAAALADANSLVTLAVPAASAMLAGVPAGASDPATGAIAARKIGDIAHLDKLGEDTGELGRAARALAAIARTDTQAARAELGPKPPKLGIVAWIEAVLAEIAGDAKKLDETIRKGLASDQQRTVLAFAAGVASLDKPTLAALVTAAEKVAPSAPGVTSLIGLAAAEAGVEKPRALALVSARELDELELARLEPLVATGADATSLRLRAEIALRRGDEARATIAIGTFASEAPQDPRSARYQGWLLLAKGKPEEAAAQFEKAGARRELARAWAAASYQKALAAVDGKPTTPEELVLLAQKAMAENNLSEAERYLLEAEKLAPANPLVQATLARLAAKQSNEARLRLAQLLAGMSADMIEVEPAPVIVSGGSQHKAVGSVPEKVIIDLRGADPRVLEPMLEALPLEQYAKKKLVIAELGWEPSALSFREAHPEVVREALRRLLVAPPYEMQVSVTPRVFQSDTVPLEELVKLTGDDIDAALVYRLEAEGDLARVTLLFYVADATTAPQVSRVVDMAGAITFNTTKLITILAIVLVVALLGILWFTRSMGKIELQIARASDADEALCVEISKNPKRPIITDMLAFHNATKSAGTITKSRTATLIASGLTLKVPTGVWFVHLYGTYSHGGKLRLVPDACSKHVEVKRGTTVEVAFDLIAKAAEVSVEVVHERRNEAVVWVNEDYQNKRKCNSDGMVPLLLPVGHHSIHVQVGSDTLVLPLHVPTAKAITMSVNVARELRLMKDLELGVDTAKAAELELVLAQGPRTPLPFKAEPDPRAKTQAASAADLAAAADAAAQHRSHPRAQTPIPGDMLLERYRITSELGRGAMGIVQRAWDEKLEREVAIKVMADDLRKIPEAMALFTSEAKALAQLNHTNIVGMYDQITEADHVYMIMEYVDGQTLEQIVAARGALPWLEAAGIIDQVCTGLAYAHARKVIHRDIKPANIFVAKDKTVKLGDFGLARVMREVTIRRTEVRGTPLYMAPEQITGTDVDHRSDLYAIGCTLFELLCGRPPFIEGDILYAQMNVRPVAPSTLTPGLPAAVDDLVLGLLEKSPDDRPGSAAEVRTILRDLSTV